MNIADIKGIKPKGQVKIDRNLSYGLSELGKAKVEAFGSEPLITADLMGYLDDYGASKVSEIAKSLEMSEEQVKEILKRLLANGYVRAVSA